ncbi:MAG: PDZ domain-containing protein [Cytophagales bacterium]|nr:MAG: PDZ domain-containing protein [Cytophagales bacterium]TAF61089.1 MAG: PDZ domain-containing protein [Cytophagales bacterium]
MKTRLKIILAGSLAFVVLSFSAFDNSDKYFEIAKNLDIFATLFKEINTYYVDDVNPNKFMETGINGMLSALDPYTNYIPEDQIEEYQRATTGQYGGIGASVGKRNGVTTVLMPYESFPAFKAGLRIGDQILKIDDKDPNTADTEEVSKMLRGQAGTDVTLLIKRMGEPKPFELVIKRDKIQISNVTFYGMITEDIGTIHLTDFTRDASREVRDALIALKEKGAKKIILDLRGNPGGLLTEAVNIANIFVPKGLEVVSTKGKVKEWNKTYNALNPTTDASIPLAVIVNRSSASASEIVAGVIQDYDRGVVIGENSYGKGLVQATRQLSYNARLKVTVAKYYTPSGRCIQAIDYSSRNEDGSVGKVPDSLRKAYKTKNGRNVLDGGGIKPDLEVAREMFAPITQQLIIKGLFFDYAVKYRYEHPNIADAKNFKLTEEEYAAFDKWLDTQNFTYASRLDKMIKDLEDAAQKEKNNEKILAQIQGLKAAVVQNKNADMQTYKVEVKEELEREIASHFYLEKGGIEASQDDDPDLKAAVQILNDSNKYQQILSGK